MFACSIAKAQDAYEPDDSPSLNAPHLDYGAAPQQHNFHQIADEDWAIYWLDANLRTYVQLQPVASALSNKWHAELYYTEDGDLTLNRTLVAQGDFGVSGLNLIGDSRPTAGRLFWVRISAIDANFIGASTNYTMSLDGEALPPGGADVYESDDVPSLDSPHLDYGAAPQLHNFHQNSDNDWAIYWLAANLRTYVQLQPQAGATTNNWHAELYYTENGDLTLSRTFVAQGDFGLSGLTLTGDSLPTAGRLFWVRIYANDPNFIGLSTGYSLSLSGEVLPGNGPDAFEPDNQPSLDSPHLDYGAAPQIHNFHQNADNDWAIYWLPENSRTFVQFQAQTPTATNKWHAELYYTEDGDQSLTRTLAAQGDFGVSGLSLIGDSRAAAGRLFWVRIRAIDTSFVGPTSNYTISLGGQTLPPPCTPALIAPATLNTTTMPLSWTNATGCPTPENYELRYATSTTGPWTTTIVNAPALATNLVAPGNGTYFSNIRACASATNCSAYSANVQTVVGTSAANEAYYFHHTNPQGSIIATTNIAGVVVHRARFAPFGTRTNRPITAGGITTTPVIGLGFAGKWEDEQLRLNYFGGRFYDPMLSRFVSLDPASMTVGDIQSFNRYAYANNNPLGFVDPNGNNILAVTDWIDFGTDVGGLLVSQIVYTAAVINGDEAVANEAIKVMEEKRLDAAISTFGIIDPVPLAGRAIKRFAHGAEAAAGAGKAANKAEAFVDAAGACRGSKCSLPGRCFVAGTLVLTKAGLVPIETVLVGDLVASREPETGIQAWKPVTQLFKNLDRRILAVEFRNIWNVSETLQVTPNHPFAVMGKGWVNAANLSSGDQIQTYTGDAVYVVGIQNAVSQDTYNFEVADFHTYFVGGNQVWVHNSCLDPNSVAEAILNAERSGSGLKEDAGHRAASFLTKAQLAAGKVFSDIGGDGTTRTILQTLGEFQGKKGLEKGIYEFILDASGKITHQRFVSGGAITGVINQTVKKSP